VDLAMRDGVAWLTLARPATGNRCDAELLGALAGACATVEHAADVAVMVLRADGTSFCTGGDAADGASGSDGIGALAALAKPVVAAVQGEASGLGFALALACDVRIASTAATFVLPEVVEGRLPGGGATQRLARMVGTARALELVLLGTRLSARRAEAWGIVSRVARPDDLDAVVAEVAAGLAARGPLALGLAKEAVVRALDLPLADGIRLEHDLYVLLQTSADRRAGIRAFLGRRKPRFRGE
jgi:enoyl-CoA hydratase/carnithine racemase